MTIAKRNGIAIGSAGPSWNPLVTADFVGGSLVPFKDPYLLTNAALQDLGSGLFRFNLAEKATAYDGSGEAAAYRLNIATLAKGWRGDGTQAIWVKIKSQAYFIRC